MPALERRLSIKSIAASIRRPKSFSSGIASSDEATVKSRESSHDQTRRPTSLFSWRSKRRSSSTLEPEIVAKKQVTLNSDVTMTRRVLSKGSRKNRRFTKDLPPLPTLLIDFNSLPSPSSTYTFRSPLVDDRSEQSDSYFPPSLPDLRKSTFQPLDVNLYPSPSPIPSPSSPHPRSPFEVRKQLSLRGPFPSRPRQLIIASFPSPPLPIAPSPHLHHSPPRIDQLARFASDATNASLALSPKRLLPPRPPLTRPSSFTASLPTVDENSGRKLRPIRIAPRTSPSLSSTSTFPSTRSSAYTTRSTSPESFSSARASIDTPGTKTPWNDKQPEVIEKPKSATDNVDWNEIEQTLRELSEERLQILLNEVRRAKA